MNYCIARDITWTFTNWDSLGATPYQTTEVRVEYVNSKRRRHIKGRSNQRALLFSTQAEAAKYMVKKHIRVEDGWEIRQDKQPYEWLQLTKGQTE